MTITIPMRPIITFLLAFSALTGILILTEPNGFNGMKFDATRAETEKVAKLTNCEIVQSGHPEIMQFENLKCNTTLVIDGSDFRGHVLFGLPPNGGEGTLGIISAEFSKGESAFVRAAFIKRYGLPHYFTLGGNEHLTWIGNKVMIQVYESGDHANFVISPNWKARGAKVVGYLSAKVK